MASINISETELCYLSATEILALFKARKLSPVEYLNALIARAEQVAPTINAFAFEYFDEALAKAKRAEDRFMKTKGRLRPLEGLPPWRSKTRWTSRAS